MDLVTQYFSLFCCGIWKFRVQWKCCGQAVVWEVLSNGKHRIECNSNLNLKTFKNLKKKKALEVPEISLIITAKIDKQKQESLFFRGHMQNSVDINTRK